MSINFLETLHAVGKKAVLPSMAERPSPELWYEPDEPEIILAGFKAKRSHW